MVTKEMKQAAHQQVLRLQEKINCLEEEIDAIESRMDKIALCEHTNLKLVRESQQEIKQATRCLDCGMYWTN